MTEQREQYLPQTIEIVPPSVREKAPLMAGAELAGFYPKTIAEVAQIADAFMKAGMVPQSYEGKESISAPEKKDAETKSKLMLGIMKGLEVGLGPVTAISTIAIINNRPSIYGDGGVALVQRTKQLEKMTVEQIGTAPKPTDTIATYPDDYGVQVKMWRKGQAEPYIGKFTVGDAKRAKLWMNAKKQPWMDYPERMLFSRARAFALRDGFSDCLMGLSIAEEVQDLPTEAPAPVDASFLDDAPKLPPPPAQDGMRG